MQAQRRGSRNEVVALVVPLWTWGQLHKSGQVGTDRQHRLAGVPAHVYTCSHSMPAAVSAT